MSSDHRNPLEHPEVQQARAGNYLFGFLLATALMGASLLVATRHALPAAGNEATVAVIALVTVVAQLRLLFHLDWSVTRRWHTLALVLTVPLFVMLIGLSLWMFHSLDAHMLGHGFGPPM
ncbi:MAG: cytochrome o ubiquinol oxidase subunit IV [Acidiferrobacterales bacterium]